MLDHHGNGEWSSNIGAHCNEVNNNNNNTLLDADGRRKKKHKKNDKKEPGVKFTITIVVRYEWYSMLDQQGVNMRTSAHTILSSELLR